MNTTTRRALFAAAAAVATGLGVGAGWQRWRPQAAAAGAATQLWGQTLRTVDGVDQPLAAWRGRATLVNFWATWCPPCIEEMPMLDAFYQANSERCHVLGLAIDQAKAVQGFLQKQAVHYPILLAGSQGLPLSKALGNAGGGLPFTVFLDAQGDIQRTKVGKLQPADLDHWLSSLPT